MEIQKVYKAMLFWKKYTRMNQYRINTDYRESTSMISLLKELYHILNIILTE